jgi:uncharacterized membrane protein
LSYHPVALNSTVPISVQATDHRAESETGIRAVWITWAIVTAIGLSLVGLIICAPLLQSSHPVFAASIYKTFSYVCHQIPERSFHVAGHQFAVCSRCTGLYSGFAVATLVYPLARSLKRTDTPRRIWLFLAPLPLVIDFSLTYFGVWQNNHTTRFATGALLGSVAVFYVLPGLIELSLTVRRRLPVSGPPSRSGF